MENYKEKEKNFCYPERVVVNAYIFTVSFFTYAF